MPRKLSKMKFKLGWKRGRNISRKRWQFWKPATIGMGYGIWYNGFQDGLYRNGDICMPFIIKKFFNDDEINELMKIGENERSVQRNK